MDKVFLFPVEPLSPCGVSQTRPRSSMDRWVCSRLRSTVLQCERGFEAHELSAVTAAIHSFRVHSLCDVYLVRQPRCQQAITVCVCV